MWPAELNEMVQYIALLLSQERPRAGNQPWREQSEMEYMPTIEKYSSLDKSKKLAT
jgi:hypothetical protein